MREQGAYNELLMSLPMKITNFNFCVLKLLLFSFFLYIINLLFLFIQLLREIKAHILSCLNEFVD